MSMKNTSDTIGNRTRNLQACSTVPQPTAPPRAPFTDGHIQFLELLISGTEDVERSATFWDITPRLVIVY
jgi:hypothetical protein